MRRILCSAAFAALVAFSAVRLAADSRPVLTGGAAGIELCPQSICGFALFVGQFEGEVNSRPADGGFVALVEHGPLPINPFDTAPITGGDVTITAGKRVFKGDIVGGSITNLNGVQYCVAMAIDLTSGGKGTVHFTGLLDHGPFPPTIAGFVTQDPLGPCLPPVAP
jgi:hypothetical protein